MPEFSVEKVKGKSLDNVEPYGQTSRQGTHYKMTGEGALVVLIHGLGGYSFIFEQLQEELSKKYKVLRYDLIGRGFSGPGIRYTLEEHLEQLEGLLKELSLLEEPCYLIAHSMGGVIASTYTAVHSKQVKGCILLAPAGAMDSPIPAFASVQSIVRFFSCCCIPMFANTVFSGPPPAHENAATPANNDGPNVIPDKDLQKGDALVEWMNEHCMASTRKHTGTPLAASVARMPLTNLLNARNRRSGINRFIGYSDVDAQGLKARAIPMLILCGDQDVTCRNIQVNSYKRVFGENVTIQSTPGRHCFFVQSPEPSYSLINDFLASCSSSS